jgi:hypothetical protein
VFTCRFFVLDAFYIECESENVRGTRYTVHCDGIDYRVPFCMLHDGGLQTTGLSDTPSHTPGTDRIMLGSPYVASAYRGPVEGVHSSSRLPSLPPQISRTPNPTTHLNPECPRDPTKPTRQDCAEINPPPGLLQPVEHPSRSRLPRLSVRAFDLERRVDVRDGTCDGAEAGCEPVFVEAVAEPGPCVGDSTGVLDLVDSALEGDGL